MRFKISLFTRKDRVYPKKTRITKSQQTEFFYDDKIERKSYEIHQLQSTSHLPSSIFCPITKMPMQDPVIASDGNSYERKSIFEWFHKNRISPISGVKLDYFFVPNHALRSTISELIIEKDS